MKRALLSALVVAMAFGGTPLIVGCDRTVEHEKSVETKDNGGTAVKEKKVTENPNGGTTVTEKKDVHNP